MSLTGALTSIMGSGILKGAKELVDEFTLSGEEKNEFLVKMEEIVQKRESEFEQTVRAELQAKERIITAELNQGDLYTKRARPTVIYFGLFIIFFNYCFIPITGGVPVKMPYEFWAAWGGVVSFYSLGRSYEKNGSRSMFSQIATGNKKVSLFD